MKGDILLKVLRWWQPTVLPKKDIDKKFADHKWRDPLRCVPDTVLAIVMRMGLLGSDDSQNTALTYTTV